MTNNEEHINKLCKLTNISFAEAKFVLEKNNYDMLDSLLFLEKKGRIASANVSIYNTKNYKATESNGNSEFDNNKDTKNRYYKGESFQDKCSDLVDKGNRNYLYIYYGNSNSIKLQLIAIIVLIIAAFPIVIPLFIISFLCGVKFRVMGEDINKYNKFNKKIEEIEYKIKNRKQK